MLKGNKKYIFFLTVCFTVLVVIQVYTPKPINWTLTFTKKDKIPFGTSALYSMLPEVFPGQTLKTSETPIYNTFKNTTYTGHNYIIINNVFEPDTLDTRELLKFASRGNTVFIAANHFGGKFADSLKLRVDNYFGFINFGLQDSSFMAINYKRDTVSINFLNPHLKEPRDYSYSKGIEGTYLQSFDTVETKAIGKNHKNKINFIRVAIGKGNIYISTLPEVFTNYHFTGNNYPYAYKLLSHLPVQPIIWDEYYKAGNVRNESPLRVIFNNSALMKAYYLLLLSLILFIIFGAKRRQRIIPVIEPFKNTSLQFVDIVGTLYYQTGDHKNIADKKITYFLEFIRTTFQTKTTLFDDPFIERISSLSGVDRETIKSLFYYISDISIKASVTQEELLKLNSIIEDFHKQNRR